MNPALLASIYGNQSAGMGAYMAQQGQGPWGGGGQQRSLVGFQGGGNAGAGALSGAAEGAAAGTAVMPGWGTAIGAVVGGVGGLLSTAKGANRDRARRIVTNRMAGSDRRYFDMQHSQMEKMRGLIEKGYAAQKSQTSRISSAAKRDVLARQKAMGGRLASNMNSRGLSNTTVAANAQRGLSYDTSQQLMNVDLSLANLMSSLEMGEMQGLMGVEQGIAGLYENQRQAEQFRNAQLLEIFSK